MGCLIEAFKRHAETVDVFLGQHFAGADDQLVDIGHQVFAVGEQGGDRGRDGFDDRILPFRGCQRRAVRVVVRQFDHRGTGNAGEGQPCLGCPGDRDTGVDADAGADNARIVGIKPQLGDLANTDTAELHRAAA